MSGYQRYAINWLRVMIDAQGAVISHNQERPREEAGQNQDILPQI